MAKIMVAIEIPDKTYDELRSEVVHQRQWDSGKLIVIPPRYLVLPREGLHCELIGVRP